MLFFAAMVAVLAALASGLMPAFQASRGHDASALRDDARTPERRRVRHAFITAQVALSILLVVVAGLFVRALERAGSMDPGFEPGGVELASIDLSQAGYTDVTGPQFIRGVVDRVRALPGVRAASAALVLPGGFETRRQAVTVPGLTPPEGQPFYSVDWNAVASGYFATLRIPMAAGRDFTDADGASAEPVAIVGEGTARQFWPGQQAVGQHLQQVTYGPQGRTGTVRTLRVIGVARDVKVSSLVDGLGVRSCTSRLSSRNRHPSRSLPGARAAGLSGTSCDGRSQPWIRTCRLRRRRWRSRWRLARCRSEWRRPSLGSLGLVGLLLAAIGIYGVTAYTVTRRTREIGIRMALGARPGDIARMVLRQGMSLTVVGSVIGFALAAGAGRVLTAFLFGVPPFEPVVFGAAAMLLIAAGAVACYAPARRASRVEPVVALETRIRTKVPEVLMRTAIHEFVARLAGLFGRGRRDGELNDEIQLHLDELAAEHRRRGMSPGNARAAARRDFGGVEQMKEQYRDRHGWRFLESLAQDARYTARTLRRDAVFSVVAVLTLALGIGATTTIFGGVKAVLLDPLPYPDAGRIAQILETSADGTRIAGTFGMYRGLVDRARRSRRWPW